MSPDNGSSGTIKMIQLRKIDGKSRSSHQNDAGVFAIIHTFDPFSLKTTLVEIYYMSYPRDRHSRRFKETGNV